MDKSKLLSITLVINVILASVILAGGLITKDIFITINGAAILIASCIITCCGLCKYELEKLNSNKEDSKWIL